MKDLSDYPSEAILQALDDLEWAEKNPNYEVDMGFWHTGARGKKSKCAVCLAGSVLGRRFVKDHTKEANPLDLDLYTDYKEDNKELLADKILSFNSLRVGFIRNFLDHWIEGGCSERHSLSLKILKVLPENFIEYEENPTKFKKQLRTIAKVLDEEGY